jgi:hypothetical protein
LGVIEVLVEVKVGDLIKYIMPLHASQLLDQ